MYQSKRLDATDWELSRSRPQLVKQRERERESGTEEMNSGGNMQDGGGISDVSMSERGV